MPAWNALVDELAKIPPPKSAAWLRGEMNKALREISKLRNNRHVVLYGSAFLQKPNAPPQNLQISHEDVNAFMSVFYGMNWDRGLTLILHTPGGVTNAAETIVAYLRSKFSDIEVIVPTYAMSAGTMISLAADRIVMGRQSQLGPIDPQFPTASRVLSARAIVDQFDQARREILQNPANAHVWYPVLQSIGPALLQEARNALEYGERMVAGWLEQYMFAKRDNRVALAKKAASHFNDASKHKSHGRRIDRTEAREYEIVVEDLEENQHLQEQVLTLYHLLTITIEKGPTAKILHADNDSVYVKNWQPTPQLQTLQIPLPQPGK